MPLTTYVAGDVLTASSLNDNFTFAAANPPGGLELLSTTTITTGVTTVTLTGVFSATHDAYKIIFSGIRSAGLTDIFIAFGATTNNYIFTQIKTNAPTSIESAGSSSLTKMHTGSVPATTGGAAYLEIVNPFLTMQTFFINHGWDAGSGNTSRQGIGRVNNALSYTALTLTSDANLTAGKIRVYGYKN